MTEISIHKKVILCVLKTNAFKILNILNILYIIIIKQVASESFLSKIPRLYRLTQWPVSPKAFAVWSVTINEPPHL